MKNKRAKIGILAVIVIVTLMAVAALGASPTIKWQLIGSGGGQASGPEDGFASAIGQPVSGRVSNGHTIYSGLYFSSNPPGPAGYEVLLPSILKSP